MRKVLSLLLVLTLVLTGFSFAFAAVPTDVVGLPSEAPVSVLMDLGVVDGYTDGTYKPAQTVTRAEMAKLIIVALGLKNTVTNATSKFPDMAGATWAQGFVSYASDLGIIKGYPDGTFKPSQTVSYPEAAAMIIRALGYTDKGLTGTWPANYVVKANALGIFQDILSVAGGANRGDIATMLFNALKLEIGTTSPEGVWLAKAGDTMLSRLGAELVLAAIISGSEDAAFNIRPLVGAYAETYINKTGEIIAVNAKSTFLKGEYDGTVFTAGGVEYSVSTAMAASSKAFFDNGLRNGFTTLSAKSNQPVKIAVILDGKAVTNIYSISAWVASADALVTAADLTEISTDKMLLGYDFVLNGSAIDPNAFELKGALNFSAIKTDNVVYVYADADGFIRQITVGTETVSGKITKISSSGDYEIAGRTLVETGENVTSVLAGAPGESVKAYLDFNGDIYKMKLTSATPTSYGIALATADGSNFDINRVKPAIKIFLVGVGDKIFSVDETKTQLKTDYFTAPATPNAWINSPAAGTLVKYGVNSSDVIDAMKDDLSTTITATITSKGYFAGHAIAADAVIFVYVGGGYDLAENYGVRTLTSVLGMTGVQAKYIVDAETGRIAAMLLESGTDARLVYGVATDWADNISDVGHEITFLIDGVKKTYNARQAAYDSVVLDNSLLYRLNFDLLGNISTLTPMVSLTTVTSASVSGSIVTSGATNYSLDADVIVYKWNFTTNAYDKALKSNIVNGVLYDVYGDADMVYDIVLLPPVI